MPGEYVTHPSQTYTSPDGTRGYIAIHRCASSSIGQWLRYDSGMDWDRGVGFDPAVIEDVLVVVRDPVERWLSALCQVEKWQGRADQKARSEPVFTNNFDGHFRAQSEFIAPYLSLPLTYVDIANVDAWFVAQGWQPPPNINESDPDIKKALRKVLTRTRRASLDTYYSVDQPLMGVTWQP